MFSELFAFSLPARVNFVGGGGKTSLILELLEECSQSVPTVYTTTTRIHPPQLQEGMAILSGDNEELLQLVLARAARDHCRGHKFVVTRLPCAPGLLRGVSCGFADALAPDAYPLILNEADGARSMSLKMPRDNEPVLLSNAAYLVPVIGLDCLHQPLGPGSVFRWELAWERYRLRPGEILTPELAASILLHPEGVCNGWRPGMQILPFINKVDTEAHALHAQALSRALLGNGNYPVKRVVWGSVQSHRAESMDG